MNCVERCVSGEAATIINRTMSDDSEKRSSGLEIPTEECVMVVQSIKAELGLVDTLKEELLESVDSVMIVQEGQYNNPGVSVMKEEVWDDTDVTNVKNNADEALAIDEISITKHELCWNDWGVGDIKVAEMNQFGNGRKVRGDLSIAEEAPNSCDTLAQEPVAPEFVSVDVDGVEAQVEKTKVCVDPLAGGDGVLHNCPQITRELQYCPNGHHFETCTDSSPRDISDNHMRSNCKFKKFWKRSLRREQSHDIPAELFSVPQTQFQCKTCNKTFPGKRNLFRHMRRYCGPRECFKCYKCGKTYKLQASLLAHVENDCGRLEPHKCESCGKTFNLKYSLRSHLRHDCGRREPHKCETCGKTFNLKNSLLSHLKHDCGQEPHRCESCDKTFNVKGNLLRHVKYDCGRQQPHMCQLCGKTFKYITHFWTHVKHDRGHPELH